MHTRQLLAIAAGFVLIASPVSADLLEEYRWHDKLSRGVVNAVSSPIEIARGIDLTSRSQGVAKGWTIGLVKGFAGTGLRLGAGVLETLTFPFNWPDEFKDPLIEPKFVWEDWHGEYLE